MAKDISIQFRGDVKAEAVALWQAISDPEQVTIDEPVAWGRPGRAALGLEVVVITLVLTGAAKRALKASLDRLERFVQDRRDKTSPADRSTIEIVAENPQSKSATKYELNRKEKTSSALRIVKEIQRVVNEL